MNSPDQMHPQDRRNLIIFAILAISMWVGYDLLVARPHAEALRAAALAEQARKAQILHSAPAEILDTAIVRPRADVIASTPRVPVKNTHMNGSINLVGGRIDDLQLKDYFKTVERKDRINLLSPARTDYPRYVETGWIASGVKDVPDSKTRWQVKAGSAQELTPQTPVTLTYKNSDGVVFEKTYTLDEDFGFQIVQTVTNPSDKTLTLYPFALVTEHGLPEDFLNQGVVHEGPIAFIGESLEERDYADFKKKPEETITGSTGWIGLTGKYWLTALSPIKQGEESKYRFISSPAISEQTKDRYQTDITGSPVVVEPGKTGSYGVNIFSGPKKVKLLDRYAKEWNAPKFDLAVDFGWFYFLTKPFFLALHFLYGLTGNFGVAIIIFTCILRVFVFPLANTSYKSFAQLRKVSPEMYELRHKYKDDKQKLQEELVKLYQKHNVNPMAGCLPILVQIPIFFALYKVLSNTIEMRHAPFFGWIQDLSAPDPTTIFNLFGLIPWSPPSFLMIGIWPLLMLAAMIVQRHLSPPPEDPIQAKLIAVMPYLMTFIMAGFASGLVIYWTINNILAIFQQMIIMRSMGVPIHLFTKDQDQKKLEQEIKDGPIVHPSLEMAEEKIEDAILGDGAQHAKEISKPTPRKKKKK